MTTSQRPFFPSSSLQFAITTISPATPPSNSPFKSNLAFSLFLHPPFSHAPSHQPSATTNVFFRLQPPQQPPNPLFNHSPTVSIASPSSVPSSLQSHHPAAIFPPANSPFNPSFSLFTLFWVEPPSSRRILNRGPSFTESTTWVAVASRREVRVLRPSCFFSQCWAANAPVL